MLRPILDAYLVVDSLHEMQHTCTGPEWWQQSAVPDLLPHDRAQSSVQKQSINIF